MADRPDQPIPHIVPKPSRQGRALYGARPLARPSISNWDDDCLTGSNENLGFTRLDEQDQNPMQFVNKTKMRDNFLERLTRWAIQNSPRFGYRDYLHITFSNHKKGYHSSFLEAPHRDFIHVQMGPVELTGVPTGNPLIDLCTKERLFMIICHIARFYQPGEKQRQELSIYRQEVGLRFLENAERLIDYFWRGGPPPQILPADLKML